VDWTQKIKQMLKSIPSICSVCGVWCVVCVVKACNNKLPHHNSPLCCQWWAINCYFSKNMLEQISPKRRSWNAPQLLERERMRSKFQITGSNIETCQILWLKVWFFFPLLTWSLNDNIDVFEDDGDFLIHVFFHILSTRRRFVFIYRTKRSSIWDVVLVLLNKNILFESNYNNIYAIDWLSSFGWSSTKGTDTCVCW
jgi:hypothetical protein